MVGCFEQGFIAFKIDYRNVLEPHRLRVSVALKITIEDCRSQEKEKEAKKGGNFHLMDIQ